VSDQPTAEDRLARLLGRLLGAAEASLAAGDLESARSMAEEVRAVDPGNVRAAEVLRGATTRLHAPEGERALMTLLFSDLVGSTMLSEQVEPEQLRDLFALYRATAREAVERYGGYVMKYMGDGILAGFGYPDPHEDDARRGVLAALDLVAAMRATQADLSRRFGVVPQVRVGIHTGRVVVADLSDDRSIDERDSIVGVAPNLAARIQQAAAPDQVVISDVTQHLVDADFYLSSVGERELKGIRRPVEAFAVDRPRHAGARFHAERYRRGSLVDRDQPRSKMVAAWRAVQDTTALHSDTVFLVAGEAGIGKTRLVAEMVNTVEAEGGRVLGAGCLPYYSNVALWPITQMLERILSTASDDPVRLDLLVAHLESLGIDPARSVPFLGPLIGVGPTADYPAPELDPSAVLDETLSHFVQWLAALGAQTPRLFVVEDLHWADPSTMALLGRLAQSRAPGVLTVATTRVPDAVPWRDEATLLLLTRLAEGAAARLVETVAGTVGMDADLRSAIVERAEGIPLFLEELTRSCLDESRDDPMPLRLQELFTWRLKAPGVDLRVAQAAATVGPTFDAAVVADVVGDAATVDSQMVILTNDGLIEPVDPQAHLYRFRHALLRDAAYETQVLDLRSLTHARVAEILLARGAEPALVAEHLDRAGDAKGATGQYLLAAQAEQVRGAHTEAAGLLTRALELLQTLPESEDRDLSELTDRMLRALSVSSMQGYAAQGVQDDHRQAEVLAARLGSRPEVLPSLIAIWAFWFASGELGTARGLIERLHGLVSQAAFSWFEPEVESCAGWQDLYEGHLDDARAHQEEAMQGFLARPVEQSVSPFWPLPNDPIAVSAISLACLATLRGDPEEAERREAQALARAEQIGFPRGPWSMAFVKTYAAWMRYFRGDRAEARALGAEVVAIGQEHGYAYWTMLGSSYLAGTSLAEPDRAFLEQVVVTLRAMGQEAFAASNLAALAELVDADGDIDAAHDLIEQALLVVQKTGERLHLPDLLVRRAAYTLARGGLASDAAADLRDAIEVASEQGARVTRLRAALALARLPESRTDDWKDVLASARAAVSPTLTTEDTAAADALLT
jgi:class 3 adenylate cyclase/tetratricopeptide (TPR) repeat protein